MKQNVEKYVEEYAERLESTDFGGNIGCYVLAIKDSNDANSGVPIEIEKHWIRATLTKVAEEAVAAYQRDYEEHEQKHIASVVETAFEAGRDTAMKADELSSSKQVDMLIAVTEWLFQRGYNSAAKELSNAMCKKFGL